MNQERFESLMEECTDTDIEFFCHDDRVIVHLPHANVHFIDKEQTPNITKGPSGFSVTASKVRVFEEESAWEFNFEDQSRIEIEQP